MTGTFLTEAQWLKVGKNIKPGVRELIIKKDLYGNAVVRIMRIDGVAVKNLKGNVVEFPIKATPEKVKSVELFNRFIEAARKVGLDIGVTLGLIELVDEGDDADGDLSE